MENTANNIDLIAKTETEDIDEEKKAMKLFNLEDKVEKKK